MRKNRRLRILKNCLAVIISALIIYYIGRTVYLNLHQLKEITLKINYFYLGIALIALFLSFLVNVFAWLYFLRLFDHKISFMKMWKILALPSLGRYIPGKIWSIAGVVYFAGKEGISRKKTSLGIAISMAISLLAALVVFLISLAFWPSPSEVLSYIRVLLVLPFILVMIHPKIFLPVTNKALKIIKRTPITVEISYKHMIVLTLQYILLWLLQGLSFYFIIRSLFYINISQIPAIIGVYPLAWVIGFLSFITPGGIGVREGIIVYLLSFIIPQPIAIMAALISRIISTIQEICQALVALKIK